MEASFILNSFRSIISVIDRAVYGLISFLYQILQLLAEKQIFSGDVIDSFATRVYTLLGLIMVFKVTFSLINYIVNPDLMLDKEQGPGNIAKNIVITLVLIIITPYLFDFGYRLQGAILKDNILPRLILETDDTNSTSLEVKMDPVVCDGRSTYVDNYGDYMAMMTLRPFYQFDKTVLNRNRNDYIEDQYCKAKNTNDLLTSEIYKADEGISDQNNVGSYLIDYSLILSTVAGVIVALMLLTLCMDVAVRTIKLGFLEIVSPIPIISYIDPKSGKDGMFKKWYKEVFGTWLGLFVKLAAIYFAIYIISLVGQADLSSEEHGIWIMLFLIIGALMFAKQFTKLIEDIFGLKVDGLSLNPIKKIKDQALGGDALLKASGKITSDLAARGMSAIGSIQNRQNAKKKFAEDMRNAEAYARNRDYKNDPAFKEEMRRLTAQKVTGQMSAAEWRSKIKSAKNDAINRFISEEQGRVQEEFNKKFSNRHPFLAGVAANQRAGHQAFVDSKSIKDIIKSASDAATNAAKMRTYTDNYSAMDRLKNMMTDWGDIKYKGGTADLIDSNIKELNDRLTSVTNALDSLRQAQGMFPPGTFSYNTATGEIGLGPAGQGNASAIENIKQTNELQQTFKDLNSEIKKQTKILEQQKNMKK